MKISASGLELIKKFEGLSLKPYADIAGKMTIGYGHLILPSENFDKGISSQEAESLLLQDIAKFEKVISKFSHRLNQSNFDALVSLVFNIGIGAFEGSTLFKKLHDGENEIEIAKEFIRWIYAGGKPSRGLLRRRLAEAQLYLG